MTETLSDPEGDRKVVDAEALLGPPKKMALTCTPKDFGVKPEFDMSGPLVEPPSPAQGLGQPCRCGRRVEMDGWCAAYGPYDPSGQGVGPWLCDECVFAARLSSAGSNVPPPKPPMTREQVVTALETAETARRNLTIFQGFLARDPSGACRDIDYLSLTYTESKPILDTVIRVLQIKLQAMGPPITKESFPA